MGKTVLIVDDSMSIRQLVKATLLTKGYNVVDACDGVDALNKLGSQRVNLVISDVNMPNMDGISLLKAIKAKPEHKFTPVIMLTTESQDSVLHRGASPFFHPLVDPISHKITDGTCRTNRPDTSETAPMRATSHRGRSSEGRRSRRAVERRSQLCFRVASGRTHVRIADVTLDIALGAFANDLLELVKGDTSNELYGRYFAEPHEDVIAMGLDSEVPEVTLIVHALDRAGDDAPASLRAHLEPLRTGLKLGNGALASRSDALADLGRHSARVEAWYEAAESTLGSIHARLGRISESRGLPETWPDAFFNVD